jgi:hypothetical protein
MNATKISRSIRRAVNLAAHKVGLAAAAAEKERLIAEIVSQRKADALLLCDRSQDEQQYGQYPQRPVEETGEHKEHADK